MAAPVPVQAVSAQSSGAASSIVSPTFTSTSGNLLVANWADDSGGTPASPPISDNNSNAWVNNVARVSDSGALAALAQSYAKNISGRSGHTVTYTITNAGALAIAVVEVSGADKVTPLDQAPAGKDNTPAANNPHNANALTPTVAGTLAVAGTTGNQANNNTFAATGTGTVQTSQTGTANLPIALSTDTRNDTTTVTEGFNLTADDSVVTVCVVANFIGAALSGGYLGVTPANRIRPGAPNTFFKSFQPFAVTTGPISNIVTATDSLAAMSDSATRIVSLPRSFSETLNALSEVATRIVSLPRTGSDTLSSLSETVTRIVSLPRSSVDTLGALSDTATRSAQAFVRTAQDSLASLSETVTRIVSLPRTATDNLPSMSDTAAMFKVIIRNATDTLAAMSDTATRSALSFSRTATDSLAALSDSATRVQTFVRTALDNLSALSDTATRFLSLPRSSTDSLTALSDTAIRAALSVSRTAVDNLQSLSDTATRSAQTFLRSALDNLPSMSDIAQNGAIVIQTFLHFSTFCRDGTLRTMARAGNLITLARDGSLITRARDATLKTFGRDSSGKGKTRG